MSKQHLVVRFYDEAATLTDLSVNGTYLNGIRLPRDEPKPIKPGDVITLLTAESTDFAFVFVPAQPEGDAPSSADPRVDLVRRVLEAKGSAPTRRHSRSRRDSGSAPATPRDAGSSSSGAAAASSSSAVAAEPPAAITPEPPVFGRGKRADTILAPVVSAEHAKSMPLTPGGASHAAAAAKSSAIGDDEEDEWETDANFVNDLTLRGSSQRAVAELQQKRQQQQLREWEAQQRGTDAVEQQRLRQQQKQQKQQQRAVAKVEEEAPIDNVGSLRRRSSSVSQMRAQFESSQQPSPSHQPPASSTTPSSQQPAAKPPTKRPSAEASMRAAAAAAAAGAAAAAAEAAAAEHVHASERHEEEEKEDEEGRVVFCGREPQ